MYDVLTCFCIYLQMSRQNLWSKEIDMWETMVMPASKYVYLKVNRKETYK